jgi:hypothetical protein
MQLRHTVRHCVRLVVA